MVTPQIPIAIIGDDEKYLLDDSIVVNKSGKRLIVRTGLKDYQMVEILAGIDANEELIPPEQ